MRGNLMVKYWPCAENGVDEPEDDVMCDEPHELVGKEIYFRVEIDKATNLPADLCKNVFVRYQFKHEPGVIYQTEEFDGQNMNPVFNYQKVHYIDMVTDYIIDYIDSGNIAFKVYAYPKFETKNKGKVDRQKSVKAEKVVSPKQKAPAAAPKQPAAAASSNKESVVVTEKTTHKVEESGAKGSACCSIF